jgi:DNA-damage-inducible protein J
VLVNFLDSPGASKAKKEADTGKITTIGSLMDFDNWIDKLVDRKLQEQVSQSLRTIPEQAVIK